jgi:exopolysaccharide production protein ExoQ
MPSNRKDWRWYYVASAVFLLQSSEALGFIDTLVYGQWAYKPGDIITRSLNLLGEMTAVLLFWRARKIGSGWMLALAFVVFLVLSTAWSIDPPTTFRRGIIGLFIVVGAIGVAGNLEADEAINQIGAICYISAIASIVLLIFSPSIAVPSDGFFRGIFTQKNGLGQVMAMGVLTNLHSIQIGYRRLSRAFALILCITLGVLCHSSTALTLISFYGATNGIVALYRKGGATRMASVFLTVLLAPVAGILLVSPDILYQLMGKDATLSGRTDIWAFVWSMIQQRPILGWGYGSFFTSTNPLSVEISAKLGYGVAHSHNALLQMLLDVGIVGAGLFIVTWIRNIVLALKCMNTSEKQLATTSLLGCVGIFIGGITEPVEPGIVLIAFFIMGIGCERAILAARRQRHTVWLRPTRLGTRPGLIHPR